MRFLSICAAVLLFIGAGWTLAQKIETSIRSVDDEVSALPRSLVQRVEIGQVQWGRDLRAAQQSSEKSGKPILVLFQEVPGCAGCQKFGREVLSHPLIVDAIENEFIPMLVYNNRSTGQDAQLLKRFQEPAWNYQVMRFLDSKANDILPRKDQVWTREQVSKRLVEALEKARRPVPNYLRSIVGSSSTADQQMAAFAMHCFWTGEYELGKIDGVTATEAGWLDGREVTLVRYDPEVLTLKSLASQASQLRCAEKIYTPGGHSIGRLTAGKLDNSFRAAQKSDQKRQLARLPLVHSIPAINATQLTKLNALLPRDAKKALAWLSPSQRRWFAERSR